MAEAWKRRIEVPLGLYILRGDNIAVIGEMDEDIDRRLDLANIKAQPLAQIWVAWPSLPFFPLFSHPTSHPLPFCLAFCIRSPERSSWKLQKLIDRHGWFFSLYSMGCIFDSAHVSSQCLPITDRFRLNRALSLLLTNDWNHLAMAER